jgi:PKD repeat protein
MRSSHFGGLLVLALSAGAPSLGEDAPGTDAHYVVFELDASGKPQPMSYRLVHLADAPASKSDTDVALRVSAGRETEAIVVRAIAPDGSVAFQDVAEVPRWVNLEHGLYGEGGPIGEELLPAQKAFAVRVPVAAGPRLRLTVVRDDVPAPAAAEFDLASLSASAARLPLASFASRLPQASPLVASSGNRLDLLVMGDGYMASEQAKFNTDAANVFATFFNMTPYKEYASYVNTATLFTASAQSGADHPPYSASCASVQLPTCCADPTMNTDPLRGTFVNTAFDATYCSFNTHRNLGINNSKVMTAAAAAPDWDKILVVVNDATYGGSGGPIGVVSTHALAVNIAQHEFGHSFTRLADEYSAAFPGYPPCSDVAGPAACEPNVTDQTLRASIKWNAWILPATPIPTTGTDPNLVGLYLGARYLAAGMYRPQVNCIMRALGIPFCKICAEAYVLRLYTGGWGNPSGGIRSIEPGSESPAPGNVPLALPASLALSVGLLQPSGGTLTSAWTVNGAPAGSGASFTFRGATPGTYVVKLATHDGTPLVSAAAAGTKLDSSRTWTVTATGTGGGSPSANFTVSPAAPATGQNLQFTDTSTGAPTAWAWTFGDGGVSSTRNPVHAYTSAGTYPVALTVTDGTSWSTTTKNVTVSPATGGASSTLTVPIVLSSGGANGSFYTSELGLTNRGATDATITFAYTAAFGGASGTAGANLAAGHQTIVSDAIAYLRGLGIPLGDSGNRGGTLRVTFNGLSSADAGAATVRTTTVVPDGRAGLAYSGLPSARLLNAPVVLCGLRQNATDRSNVAVVNAGAPGDGDIVLRLTVISGDPANPQTQALPLIALSPGGFNQISGILTSNGLSLTNAIVKVERVSGTAPFATYAVVNDQANSDGSFVDSVPFSAAAAIARMTLPVVVETSAFSTEAVFSNFTASARTLRLTYVASALPGGSVTFDVPLGPNEQQILPDFVQVLRNRGIVPGARGPTFAGALFATDLSGDLRGVSIGARTSSAGGGGRYGLYYSAVPAGAEATTAAWLFGLQQNAENRTNLALVNVGSVDSSTNVYRIEIWDGETGQKAATVDNVAVPAKGFFQINTVLAQYAPGVQQGYALVTRTAGANPSVVYAVVNDGGQPGQRSGDGAFVAANVPGGP